jgi:hypothetical protein
MELFEVRPRFTKTLALSMEEIGNKVKSGLINYPEIKAVVNPNFIVIKVPGEEQHLWTPQLSIQMETDESGKNTILYGLYGPRSDVWMLFMFLYFVCGLLTLFISIIGLSQYQLGMSAYILWLIPFTLGGIFVLWFTSRTGQRLGRKEMRMINDFVDKYICD